MNTFIGDEWKIPAQAKEGYEKLTYVSPSTFDFNVNLGNSTVNYEPIPGIHKLNSTEGHTILFTAINIPTIELDGSIANTVELENYLSSSTSIINVDDGNLKDSIHNSRVGSEQWRLILYLITFLLIIEMIVASIAVRKTSN